MYTSTHIMCCTTPPPPFQTQLLSFDSLPFTVPCARRVGHTDSLRINLQSPNTYNKLGQCSAALHTPLFHLFLLLLFVRVPK